MNHYILDGSGRPVLEPDLMKWAKWFHGGTNHHKVAVDTVGDATVATVFQGIDYTEAGEPLLWETEVFGGKFNRELRKCSGNREQAEAMHAAMVERVKT